MEFLVKLAIRVVVFGIALAFASRVVPDVKIQPRSALPIVALIFAALNTLLYGFLKGTMNVLTLWILWFAVPFFANMALLWLTDKLSKPLRIDGLSSLAAAGFVMTLAHILLRVAHL
jgi:uncharacterized membrane protein YvlD (DUF360 family)